MGIDLGADADIIRRYWNPLNGDICVDVGFGPGPWTLHAARRGAFVYAFDASRAAQNVLLDDLAHIHHLSNVVICPFALWDSTGIQKLVRDNQVVESSSAEDGRDVATTTLDAFLDSLAIVSEVQWINLDCEGAELRVLKGAKKTISLYEPTIIIEVHNGVSRDEIKSFLCSLSYAYEFVDVSNFLIASTEAIP